MILIIIVTYIIKLNIDIKNIDEISIPNNVMKKDFENNMIKNGKITMPENYEPGLNDVITLNNLQNNITNIINDIINDILNDITIDTSNFVLKNDSNEMKDTGRITMYKDYIPFENDVITKKYFENNIPITSNTDKGIIKLSNHLSGTADMPEITDGVITTNKFANLDQANILLGSDNKRKINEYSLDTSYLEFNNDKLTLINNVKTVNGAHPDANGNVSTIIGRVITGTKNNLNNVIDSEEGDIYVVSNDSIPDNNGITYIYSKNPNIWLEITPNLASTDQRYLQLSVPNKLLSGSRIQMPSNYIPVNDEDVTTLKSVNDLIVSTNINTDNFLKNDKPNTLTMNSKISVDPNYQFNDDNELISKKYVNDQLLNIPDASISNKGLVQLIGDLTGTANRPEIANNVITLNKFNSLSNKNILIGTNSTDNIVRELQIGNGLVINNSVLSTILTNNVGKLNVIKSNTIYTRFKSDPKDSEPVSVSDFDLIVYPGEKVKLVYNLNFQSVNGTAYAPSFGFKGVSTSDFFQASIIGFFQKSSAFSSFSVIYANNSILKSSPISGGADLFVLNNTNADNNLLAVNDSVSDNNNDILAITNNRQAIPLHIEAYYENNQSTQTTISLLFTTDNKSNSYFLQINGGVLDYTYY
jgi:hypothetical protein